MKPIEFTEAGDPALPCLLTDHGPGDRTAYCRRCGQYVNVAIPVGCSSEASGQPDPEERAKQRFREFLGCGKKGDFVSRKAAREAKRVVERLRLAKRVDHRNQVVDSETLPWVLFICCLLLAQKLEHDVVGVVPASVAVNDAHEEGDGHA